MEACNKPPRIGCTPNIHTATTASSDQVADTWLHRPCRQKLQRENRVLLHHAFDTGSCGCQPARQARRARRKIVGRGPETSRDACRGHVPHKNCTVVRRRGHVLGRTVRHGEYVISVGLGHGPAASHGIGGAHHEIVLQRIAKGMQFAIPAGRNQGLGHALLQIYQAGHFGIRPLVQPSQKLPIIIVPDTDAAVNLEVEGKGRKMQGRTAKRKKAGVSGRRLDKEGLQLRQPT